MNRQEILEQIENKEIKLSYSSLKQFAQSPEHFMRYKMKEFRPSSVMIFGSYVHAVVLEGDDVVNERYEICGATPSTDKQYDLVDRVIELAKLNNVTDAKGHLIAGEEIYANAFDQIYTRGSYAKTIEAVKPYITAKLEGKTAISEEDQQKALWLKDRIFNNKVSGKVLNNLVATEQGVEWTSYNGYHLRGFADGLSDEGAGFVFDLKLTNAEPERCQRQIHSMKYYVQAAMYKQGFAKNGRDYQDSIIVCLDPKTGDISVQILDPDYLLYGLEEYKLWLQDFAEATARKKFNSNYEFYGLVRGEYSGAYNLRKPTWAEGIMPVFENPEEL